MVLRAFDRDDPAADGSRWAKMRTSLQEEHMRSYWLGFAIPAELGAIVSFTVILIILLKPHLRKQTFNKFIVGLVIPDFIFGFFCAIACFTNILEGRYVGGDLACQIQAWYCIYGFSCSIWMNVVIARELKRLVTTVADGKRYRAPSNVAVCSRIAAVHVLAACFAAVPLIPGLPADVGLFSGLACLPMEYDQSSTIFQWTFTMPLMLAVPFVSIAWYFLRACRSFRSVTLSAADRSVTKFFGSLLFVLLVMWIPAGLFLWVFTYGDMAFWGGLWSHVQGTVSGTMYLMKADIREELRSLVCVRRRLLSRKATPPAQHSSGSPSVDNLASEDSNSTADPRTSLMATQTSLDRLSQLMYSQMLGLEWWPMQVIPWAGFVGIGRFPRSSDNLTQLWTEGDIVIFVSHRWWDRICPDNVEGEKYTRLCKGIKRIMSKHGLDASRVVIWIDWACIPQDDEEEMRLGIASLIAYAARSDYVLIPVASDPASVQHFRTADNPITLKNYGERAWCRLEVYMFMCVAEVRQRPPYCFGFGPIDCSGLLALRPRERLLPLFKAFTEGVTFDLDRLPSTGVLTVESDRSAIQEMEENMRNMYVHRAILEQKLRLEANARHRKCRLSGKQVRCVDVTLLVSEIFSASHMAGRVSSLHLDGNLLGPSGAERLMQRIVCNPVTRSLAVLDLSNNPGLSEEGLSHIAEGLKQETCFLTTLSLATCNIDSNAAQVLARAIPYSQVLSAINLSGNNIDDTGCEALVEACGGVEDPFAALEMEGNPLSPASFSMVATASAARELGHNGCRDVALLRVQLQQSSTVTELKDFNKQEVNQPVVTKEAMGREMKMSL